jgi:hypothetical protein
MLMKSNPTKEDAFYASLLKAPEANEWVSAKEKEEFELLLKPYNETLDALKEAKEGKYAGTIDTSSMEAFLKSCE